MPKVIAVLGMPGSGKSEAIEFLQSRYQWPKVYFGDVTFNEMKRRELDRTQANERLVREDLRNIHGDDYYAQEVIKMIEGLGDAPIVLVESLYSGDEYRVLKHHFGDDFSTIAIHARPKLRHERLLSRPERPLSLQESEERDWAQLNRLTQGTPIALSDYMVINQGSREELQANLEQAVQSIMNS